MVSFKDKPKGGKGKSLSKRAISEISDAARFAEKIGSDKTFSDLAKQYKQFNVKYDRPATFRETYGEEVNKVGTPLASTYYKDPVTGEERFFTAQAPTFRQLAGDIGRGLFSGYNTLSYDPNAGGIPTTTGGQIVRQKGLFPLLAEKGTPLMQLGKAGLRGIEKLFAPKPKATYGGTSSITTTTETTPSFDLEAKMSAYEDPIKFYASSSKQKYPGYSDQQSQYYYGDKQKESPTGDQYLYADAGDAAQNYMNLLKNVQNLGKTQYGNFGIQDILSNPTLTYEKEIGPGTLSGTIGDNKASLGYSMIFNKGGRVRGTGIMGALR